MAVRKDECVNLAREPILYTMEGARRDVREDSCKTERIRGIGASEVRLTRAHTWPVSLPSLCHSYVGDGSTQLRSPPPPESLPGHHHQRQQHPSNCLFDEKTNLGNKPRYLSGRVNSVFRDFHFRVDFLDLDFITRLAFALDNCCNLYPIVYTYNSRKHSMNLMHICIHMIRAITHSISKIILKMFHSPSASLNHFRFVKNKFHKFLRFLFLTKTCVSLPLLPELFSNALFFLYVSLFFFCWQTRYMLS